MRNEMKTEKLVEDLLEYSATPPSARMTKSAIAKKLEDDYAKLSQLKGKFDDQIKASAGGRDPYLLREFWAGLDIGLERAADYVRDHGGDL
jgi:hypothetical protein